MCGGIYLYNFLAISKNAHYSWKIRTIRWIDEDEIDLWNYKYYVAILCNSTKFTESSIVLNENCEIFANSKYSLIIHSNTWKYIIVLALSRNS